MKKFFCYGKKDFCENAHLCIECPHFTDDGGEYREAPMTNADRIRAMSDEELAVVMYHPFCDKRTDKECKAFGDCNQCALEWLQQPAEDSAND